MRKVAEFIVKNKVLFFVLFAALLVYCVVSIPKVQVEYSITEYLPDSTDTKQAIEIMDREFTTYGTAKIMVKHVSYETADRLVDRIRDVEGVRSLPFSRDADYYRDSCALFSITFDGDADDPASVAAYESVKNVLSGYDLAISFPLVDDYADTLAKDMVLILALAAAVILLVLLFTSKSFVEVLAFPIVFIVAAVLNMGTNYWLGKISFVSNTVCVVLQLALAIDYAIILCHRFTEEKEGCKDSEEAMVRALSKAIPEIASSCLTTIAGLLALVCMQLRLGADLGIVLAKSIVCSILTVFLLMPGILLLFSKGMDKTRHRNFVPKITRFGKGVLKIRYVLPVLFVAAAVTLGALQGQIHYVYSTDSIDTNRPTDTQVAIEETRKVFGNDNMFVILMPKGDYERERELLRRVEAEPKITSALGIANVELKDGKYLVDALGYREFADLLDIAPDDAKYVYYAYALHVEDYWVPLYDNVDDYRVPVLDVMDFAFDLIDDGYVKLDGDQKETIDDLESQLKDAKAQLIGDDYTRLIFNIDGTVESPETFAFIERLTVELKEEYPGIIFAGESMSAYDLNGSFQSDNLKISLLTIAFIFVILMFTFKSWGIPVVLVAVIQGAIFLNFGYVVLAGSNLFFFVYLIVSAIQMGATIDYAILITNRYYSLRAEGLPKREAVLEALNRAFPTVLTSGTILTVAAFLIGFIVSDPLIASIGMCLGRGTVISILSVMTVLPELLYLFGDLLEKTSFGKRRKRMTKKVKRIKVVVHTGDDEKNGEALPPAEELREESV